MACVLKVNSTLQYLNLSGNQIGNVGAMAIVMAVRSNRTLRQLLLSSNKIGLDGQLAHVKAFKENTNSRLEIPWLGDRDIVEDVAMVIP